MATAADSDDGDNKLGHVGQLCFLRAFWISVAVG